MLKGAWAVDLAWFSKIDPIQRVGFRGLSQLRCRATPVDAGAGRVNGRTACSGVRVVRGAARCVDRVGRYSSGSELPPSAAPIRPPISAPGGPPIMAPMLAPIAPPPTALSARTAAYRSAFIGARFLPFRALAVLELVVDLAVLQEMQAAWRLFP